MLHVAILYFTFASQIPANETGHYLVFSFIAPYLIFDWNFRDLRVFPSYVLALSPTLLPELDYVFRFPPRRCAIIFESWRR